MSRYLSGGLALACAMLLAGCGPSGQEELQQWVAERRANARPRVTPLVAPKDFTPQVYVGEGEYDAFSPGKLTQALRRDSNQTASNAALIAPELSRRKEELESVPLDTMRMVGYLDKASGPSALLRMNNLIYPVKIGNYLGMNYGKIVKITETAIELREIVQDSSGDWIERRATLDLVQEAQP